MRWVRLSAEEARAHPRYGLGGWLYLLFALLCVAVIADITEWFMHEPASDRPRWLIAFTISSNIAVLTAGFARWPRFPELTIAVIWIGGLLSLLYTRHMALPAAPDAPLDPRTINIAGYLLLSALLTWALVVSERVNVTFKHRRRAAA
ncbi:MAG: hypothetical protein ACOCYE_01215 [Pseudomonadota bacterium]